MTPIKLAPSAALVCALLLLGTEASAAPIYVVRHAEKALDKGEDPPLTEAGKRRADALARLLRSAKLRAVYTTALERTRKTAEPLAKALRIPVTMIDPHDYTSLVATLSQKHADDPVLIVGHSNTIPELLARLGVKDKPTIDDGDYDRLWIVLPGPKPTLITLHYGE
jgi:broad specificity phosphatase PhoE